MSWELNQTCIKYQYLLILSNTFFTFWYLIYFLLSWWLYQTYSSSYITLSHSIFTHKIFKDKHYFGQTKSWPQKPFPNWPVWQMHLWLPRLQFWTLSSLENVKLAVTRLQIWTLGQFRTLQLTSLENASKLAVSNIPCVSASFKLPPWVFFHSRTTIFTWSSC